MMPIPKINYLSAKGDWTFYFPSPSDDLMEMYRCDCDKKHCDCHMWDKTLERFRCRGRWCHRCVATRRAAVWDALLGAMLLAVLVAMLVVPWVLRTEVR